MVGGMCWKNRSRSSTEEAIPLTPRSLTHNVGVIFPHCRYRQQSLLGYAVRRPKWWTVSKFKYFPTSYLIRCSSLCLSPQPPD